MSAGTVCDKTAPWVSSAFMVASVQAEACGFSSHFIVNIGVRTPRVPKMSFACAAGAIISAANKPNIIRFMEPPLRSVHVSFVSAQVHNGGHLH